jgi:predicted nucleotidyltransferase
MTIDDVKIKIAPVMKAHGVQYAGVFGSVARGDDRPESDVDFLVRFGEPMSLTEYIGFRNELALILGRDVDVVTEKSLNEHMKPHVLPEVRSVYQENEK